MSLDVGAALRDGLRRTTARNGLVLVGVLLVVSAASTALSQTVVVALLDVLADLAREQGTTPPPEDAFGESPFALPIPATVAGVLFVGTWLLGQVVTVVAIRTFVSDVTDAVPGEFVRRRIVWVVANAVLGGVVVGILVAVGLVLLIVPGVFLAVSFYFVTQVIAVEDEDFVDAMVESWALTAGDRIEVFVLALLLVGLSLVATLPAALLGGVIPVVAAGYGVVVSAPVTVFTLATTSRAYVQLDEGRTTADDQVGALGPDDLEGPGV